MKTYAQYYPRPAMPNRNKFSKTRRETIEISKPREYSTREIPADVLLKALLGLPKETLASAYVHTPYSAREIHYSNWQGTGWSIEIRRDPTWDQIEAEFQEALCVWNEQVKEWEKQKKRYERRERKRAEKILASLGK